MHEILHNRISRTILLTSVASTSWDNLSGRQESQPSVDCVSSWICLVHLPQYHTRFLSIAETTSIITIHMHASIEQYLLQLSKRTFSSIQTAGTFSAWSHFNILLLFNDRMDGWWGILRRIHCLGSCTIFLWRLIHCPGFIFMPKLFRFHSNCFCT